MHSINQEGKEKEAATARQRSEVDSSIDGPPATRRVIPAKSSPFQSHLTHHPLPHLSLPDDRAHPCLAPHVSRTKPSSAGLPVQAAATSRRSRLPPPISCTEKEKLLSPPRARPEESHSQWRKKEKYRTSPRRRSKLVPSPVDQSLRFRIPVRIRVADLRAQARQEQAHCSIHSQSPPHSSWYFCIWSVRPARAQATGSLGPPQVSSG